MKGVKKCYGLLSVLVIMLGLSLSVFSDVNALQYSLATIPVSSEITFINGTTGSGIQYIPNSYSPLSNPKFIMRWYKNPSYNVNHYVFDDYIGYSSNEVSAPDIFYSYYENQTECSYNSRTINGWSRLGTSAHALQGYYYTEFSVGFDSVFANYGTPLTGVGLSNAVCNQMAPFGQTVPGSNILIRPPFNEGSMNNILITNRSRFQALLPYYYSYSAFNFSGSISVDGFNHYVSLSPRRIWHLDPHDGRDFSFNKFSYLEIPLYRWEAEKGGSVTEGRSIEWKGAFDFPGASASDFTWSPFFLEHGEARLYYSGIPLSNIDSNGDFVVQDSWNSGGYIDCNLTLTGFETPDSPHLSLTYDCPFIADQDYVDNSLYFALVIGIDENLVSASTSEEAQQFYVWDCNYDWNFGFSYVITDHDETPGGDIGTDMNGNEIEDNPGYPDDLSENNTDWFGSLTNLFGFTLLNPFAPLFNMFHNRECVNIPVLASMINSPESTYCPWFPSSVINITTPVISMVSVMIIFGFFIRWLGSSSGNFVEDSESHDWGSYSVHSKFKKGGKK